MTKAAELAKMGEVLTNSQIGGRRNIIINGAMNVAQRGTSSTSSGRYTLDRFEAIAASFGEATVTQSQDSTSPDEFGKSYKIAIGSTGETVGTTEQQYIRYKIEGQDLQQLKHGTSSAESMTLSFYVRSSVTGTYAISFYSNDSNKNHVKTYTVDSADTWERKSVTVSGNTSDAFDNDNAVSLSIHWMLTQGSNYLGDASSLNTWVTYSNSNFAGNVNTGFGTNANATFFLTGVQLELGSQATPFEHRSFGEELLLCQRYYRKLNDISVDSQQIMSGGYHNSTQFQGVFRFEPHMRAAPSLLASTTSSNNSSSAYVVHRTDGVDYIDSIAFHQASKESTLIYTTGNTSGTQGVAGVLLTQESDNISELAASAEL
jgi:hypothetical protein